MNTRALTVATHFSLPVLRPLEGFLARAGKFSGFFSSKFRFQEGILPVLFNSAEPISQL